MCDGVLRFCFLIFPGWPENEFCHENFRLTSRIRANHLILGKLTSIVSKSLRIRSFDRLEKVEFQEMKIEFQLKIDLRMAVDEVKLG